MLSGSRSDLLLELEALRHILCRLEDDAERFRVNTYLHKARNALTEAIVRLKREEIEDAG